MNSYDPLLPLSALGIYLHAIYISLTFGLPIAIGLMLWKWHNTRDPDFFKAAKLMTTVLAVNFALGAITGTLVEFGLVQIWPGVNLAIATFAFAPLALELIAFANEIAFLVLFIVTLGKIKPVYSIVILAVYAGFAYFSGVMIMAVNSWMQAPWGVGPAAKMLYPFLPDYGPNVVDMRKLVALRLAALATGQPISLLVQEPGLSSEIGVVLKDPMVALSNPYAFVSSLHNILAGILVGLAVVTAGYSYKFFKTGDSKYLKVVKPLVGAFAVLFVVQAPIVAHFMGEAVVEYNPTKFALMEGATSTYYDPLIAFIAYGDPSRPIVGFDQFEAACRSLGNETLGDLANALGISANLTAHGAQGNFSKVLSVKLADVCMADLQAAKNNMALVHALYYMKVTFAIIGGLAAAVLFFYFYRAPLLTSIAVRIAGFLGRDSTRVFILSLLLVLGTVIPAVNGWAVREIGRKPWTVYGLFYPWELATPVPYATSTGFLAIAYLVILAVNAGGLYAMYVVATRGYKFLDLLRKAVGL